MQPKHLDGKKRVARKKRNFEATLASSSNVSSEVWMQNYNKVLNTCNFANEDNSAMEIDEWAEAPSQSVQNNSTDPSSSILTMQAVQTNASNQNFEVDNWDTPFAIPYTNRISFRNILPKSTFSLPTQNVPPRNINPAPIATTPGSLKSNSISFSSFLEEIQKKSTQDKVVAAAEEEKRIEESNLLLSVYPEIVNKMQMAESLCMLASPVKSVPECKSTDKISKSFATPTSTPVKSRQTPRKTPVRKRIDFVNQDSNKNLSALITPEFTKEEDAVVVKLIKSNGRDASKWPKTCFNEINRFSEDDIAKRASIIIAKAQESKNAKSNNPLPK